jgi:hypothetical protein
MFEQTANFISVLSFVSINGFSNWKGQK